MASLLAHSQRGEGAEGGTAHARGIDAGHNAELASYRDTLSANQAAAFRELNQLCSGAITASRRMRRNSESTKAKIRNLMSAVFQHAMWRRKSPYPMDEDWVFASPAKKDKQPYWRDKLMK